MYVYIHTYIYIYIYIYEYSSAWPPHCPAARLTVAAVDRAEERPIMLLVGMNEFYIPLRKARRVDV